MSSRSMSLEVGLIANDDLRNLVPFLAGSAARPPLIRMNHDDTGTVSLLTPAIPGGSANSIDAKSPRLQDSLEHLLRFGQSIHDQDTPTTDHVVILPDPPVQFSGTTWRVRS